MTRLTCGVWLACLAAGLGTLTVHAQTKPEELRAEIQALKERLARMEAQLDQAAAPAPAAPAKPAEIPPAAPASGGNVNGNGNGIEFSALVDSYYSFNFNHPASRSNQLRNFDTAANQFSLNMAKLTFERRPDPLGFRLDLGIGPAFELIHAAEPGGLGPLRYLQQAYFTYNAPVGKGLTLENKLAGRRLFTADFHRHATGRTRGP